MADRSRSKDEDTAQGGPQERCWAVCPRPTAFGRWALPEPRFYSTKELALRWLKRPDSSRIESREVPPAPDPAWKRLLREMDQSNKQSGKKAPTHPQPKKTQPTLNQHGVQEGSNRSNWFGPVPVHEVEYGAPGELQQPLLFRDYVDGLTVGASQSVDTNTKLNEFFKLLRTGTEEEVRAGRVTIADCCSVTPGILIRSMILPRVMYTTRSAVKASKISPLQSFVPPSPWRAPCLQLTGSTSHGAS